MTYRKIVRGGHVVTPAAVIDHADVLIEDERIVAVTAAGAVDWQAEILDVDGCYVFPGIVDPHTHIRLDTGIYQTADDWQIGTRTAAFGGVTTVIDFATQFPGMTLPEALQARLQECAPALVDHGLHMMITDLPRDPIMAQRALDELLGLGVQSIKLYTTYRPNYYADDATILHTLRSMPAGMIAMVHCENDALVTDATQRLVEAGNTSWAFHGEGRPPEAEVEAIRRVLYLARVANKPVYVVHNSTAESIREVARAQDSGDYPPVFCETCPQYFLLDDSQYGGTKPEHFILQPPLRPGSWRVNLLDSWQTLSAISTDHCDYSLAQKKEYPDFTKTPGGLPGLETSFQLTYTAGIHQADEPIPLTALARMMASDPARIFGLFPRKGALLPGSDADLLIYDPGPEITLRAADMHTIGGYCPYDGIVVKGRVQTVLSRGEVLVDGGEFSGEPGRGQFLRGKPFEPSAC